ncbi:MAG: aminotransferase class I/II-fold pyridoxal phosphate-dependent enzyme, partial [Anaerolineales bacterium]|nr:aminotransferase class I/II-fold pyridoxal phosphate-dependent enzyme [Anaerolineales bacterium]
MNFNFDSLPNRRESESAKWRVFGDDILPMWVADMDFRSPEPVIQALRDRIDHGVFGYPIHPEGIKEAVAAWLINRHGWEVSLDDLIIIPGVVAGFHLASHAVTRPGDGVIVQTPTYGPFFNIAGNVNLVQHEMEMVRGEDGQYKIDYHAFETCLTGRSRIFMLCNPQNPTGRVFHQDELEKMAEICLQHNIIICSDEIHNDLVYKGNNHIPIASLAPEIAAKTITLIAPSK